MKNILAILILLLPLFSSATVSAVELDYFLPEYKSYNKDIPEPKSVLGFDVGEWHVTAEHAVAYLKAVEAASDRVKLVQYGFSHESRPLYYAIITSPQNHQNLDYIKTEHRRLTDPCLSADTDFAAMPVFTWIAHSIHGNEATGLNASLLLVYHLAAASDSETLSWLAGSVIFIDPNSNPDGGSRFASWVNSHKGKLYNDDPFKREQHEPWPRSRTNHYWFDLNRDFLNIVHPESRGRVAAINEWKPNVYADAHEQGSEANYHFSPGAPTRVHPLIPDRCQQLIGTMAKDYYAATFDSQGLLYFSGEVYDDYYIGRGREYTDFHGGIAILWEQPSPRGFVQATQHGPLTFDLGIRNQLSMGLATVKGAYEMRGDLLDYQKWYYKSAIEQADKDKVKAYIFGSASDKTSCYHLAEIVRSHGIDVYRPARQFVHNGVIYEPDNSYIVPLRQAQYRLIHGIFEVRDHYRDSIAYDITGWTFPLSFNLDYAELDAAAYSKATLGSKFSEEDFPTGRFIGQKDAYAYIFEWNEYYAPRALYRLLSKGIPVKVSTKPFTYDGKTFKRGSIMIPLGEVYLDKNIDEVYAIISTITTEDGIDVYGTKTGFSQGHNLGSGNFSPVRSPKIAIVGGDGTSASGVGELWHLFDTRYHIPSSVIPWENFARTDLSRYNTIIFSGGGGGLNKQDVERLKSWVSQGNILIGFEGALNFFAANGFADYNFVTPENNLSDVSYEDYTVALRSRNIAGVIFKTELDLTHPIAWGYGKAKLPIFKNNNVILASPENSHRSPINYSESPLLSGNLLPSVLNSVSGAPVVVIDRLGSGKVVGISDNPNFRGVWYGTNKLTANAVFFGNLINPLTLN